MALQVWLPFTDGTLKQQGLSNNAATQTGTINLANAGKLGKCATFTTTAGRLNLPASTMTSFTECSVALWLNVTAWNTGWDTIFQAGLGSTAWNNYIFGILRNNNNTLACTISNGSTTSSGSYVSSTLSTGTWMHLVFTYSTGKIRIYINGTLDKEYSTSIVPNFAGITYITIGNINSGSYQCNCKMNDFRIYDHCLSPMEVKQLSQGLVLHYPLNRQGWGQENLVHNSNQFRVGGHAKGVTPSVETDGTYKVIAESGNSNYSSSWWKEVTGIEDEFAEGDAFTVSFWIKSNDANKTDPPTIYLKSGMGYYSMKGTVSANYSQVYYTGTWKKANSLAPHLGWSGLVGTYYICQWKIEKGSIPTPWCPNSADTLATTMGLNGTTEYDTSGYCNNGTWHGTHTNTSDTPKYAVSTTATGSASTYLEGPILPAEAQTAALWIKCKKSQNAAIFNDKTTGLQIGLLNSILYMNSKTSTAGFTTTHWKDDDWNHVVVTYDGTTRKAYINGEAETQSGASNYYIHNADNCWLWNRSYNNNYPFNGSLSDFRIYATALSPTDVKSLYQNCATIDPDGTIRGQIRS